MSVPLWWNAGGLPIGTHFMARAGDDLMLLQLAAQLEQADRWFHKRPPRYPVWSYQFHNQCGIGTTRRREGFGVGHICGR